MHLGIWLTPHASYLVCDPTATSAQSFHYCVRVAKYITSFEVSCMGLQLVCKVALGLSFLHTIYQYKRSHLSQQVLDEICLPAPIAAPLSLHCHLALP